MSRIEEIAKKYQPIIEKEFSGIVDFSKYDDLKTNVYIKNHEDFLELYDQKDVIAFTNEKTGEIFIDSQFFSEDRLLIHEYLHRISSQTFKDKTVSGIKVGENNFAINEMLTEYISIKITGIQSSQSLYAKFPYVFDYFDRYIGYEKIKKIYFRHKILYLKLFLGKKNYSILETSLRTLFFPDHFKNEITLQILDDDHKKIFIEELFQNRLQKIISLFDVFLLN